MAELRAYTHVQYVLPAAGSSNEQAASQQAACKKRCTACTAVRAPYLARLDLATSRYYGCSTVPVLATSTIYKLLWSGEGQVFFPVKVPAEIYRHNPRIQHP
jgi:hypothetical protein